MRLWHPPSKPHLKPNLHEFGRLMRRNPDFKFYHPNYRVSPWHVQAKKEEVVLNFWPHLLKGNYEMGPGVVGIPALEKLLDSARLDADSDDISLVEDDE